MLLGMAQPWLGVLWGWASPANSPSSVPFRTTAERAPEVRLCATARDLCESCLLGILIRNLATDLHPAASAGLQQVECSKSSS